MTHGGGRPVMQNYQLTFKVSSLAHPSHSYRSLLRSGHINTTVGKKSLDLTLSSPKDQKTTMWVLKKIKESVDSISVDISNYMDSDENIFFTSKVSFSHNLHNNILTPEKIPEFSLPPRLCKRSSLLQTDRTASHHHSEKRVLKSSSTSDCKQERAKDAKMKTRDASIARRATKKPLPFSAEGYGLTGIYERPNTRRKESLFHSRSPVYVFDRSTPNASPKLVKEKTLPNKPLSGMLPHSLFKHLPGMRNTKNGNPSSSDSSPSSSLCSAKSVPSIPSQRLAELRKLKEATSCPSLIDIREKRGQTRRALTTSPSCPSSLEGSSLTLAPPVLFPLDVLQCKEKLRSEHVLSLQGRGKVHLFVERTFSTNTFSSLFTLRVHVVSVEGLQSDADRRPLNCAVNLCLTPGKLQQQMSATIKHRSLVFNEDFFFRELSREDLMELQLRLRVMNKPAAGRLRRGTVIGAITIPLAQLLPLKK